MHHLWRALRLIVLALILGCLLLLALAEPAVASVHTYHEQPGQTTYRSRQSLRDQTDLAWQVTMFKRYTGGMFQGTYLRLVGFPGQSVTDSNCDLVIETGTSAQWQAPRQLDPQTQVLPDGVAQYQMDAVLTDLQRPIPLTLRVPLRGGGTARLVAAPYVVEEWLQLYAIPEGNAGHSSRTAGF
ncbi:DUF3122 domain-containing protein [Leptolyngbya sp. CCNP1308]|uniref:DUF3122 domain-containing protein n=1 Tax=Leptolyngbya sp. CCNP1308 TaxID=3110255 RepID=UPI002B1F8A62|nr:DUF3122 domain-containing protein [Leptolyngbya sp. CCNP1308]MEA5451687.1 DUF3122 domain-containing protein [Leptolyngbya sp. CCNP1308]